MKKLPIGISDFKELISQDFYYVDKTLFIKEFVDSSGSVLLIPRPRRFGKTLNISMLRYFFEKTEVDNSVLFTKTNIWQHEDYRKLQGKYPVIFLTFKDIKEATWEDAYARMLSVISQEFKRHLPVLEKTISQDDLDDYKTIIKKSASYVTFSETLFMLSKLLYEAYNEKVLVLIDEYDAPIHAGYNYGYYDKIIQFTRSLLTSVLKDNSYLQRGILTGILRTAKEGIFSGLNNLRTCSILDTTFQDKFGFTQSEVEQFLTKYRFLENLDDVQRWYNGYTFGTTTIYNPWSLLMYMANQGKLQPYWVNTSDNLIIKKLLVFSDIEVKAELELLLVGKTVEKTIEEGIIFPNMERNDQAIWSLLLFAGYLTFTHSRLEEGVVYCDLKIPNKEIKLLYKNFIQEIVQGMLTTTKVTTFLQALVAGDIQTFALLLQEFVINSISVYDLPSNEPEKSYHLFVLGLLIYLADTYQVKSNRESGYGRYDIMLIPKDKNKLGIIIEFKKVLQKETLEDAARKALEQIKNKHYVQELKNLEIKQIKLLGIAFAGKQVLVIEQEGN